MNTKVTMSVLERRRREQLSSAFGLGESSSCEQIAPVLEELMNQEARITLFTGAAPQINMRPKIIVWLMQTADEFRLLKKTICHGVYLFDRFSELHSISKSQIYLVALVCLNLASKMEERESALPKMKALHKRLPKGTDYSEELFVDVEHFVLKHFQWAIIYPTVVNFLEYFLLFAMGPEDISVGEDQNNNPTHKLPPTDGILREHGQVTSKRVIPAGRTLLGKTSSERRTTMLDTIDTLLNFNIAEPSKMFFPSMIAAATVLIAREAAGFRRWTTELEMLTKYKETSVDECVQIYFGRVLKDLNSDAKEGRTCVST